MSFINFSTVSEEEEIITICVVVNEAIRVLSTMIVYIIQPIIALLPGTILVT